MQYAIYYIIYNMQDKIYSKSYALLYITIDSYLSCIVYNNITYVIAIAT